MTPEERLMTSVNLSKLMSDIYQAGVKRRLGRKRPVRRAR